MNHSGNDKDYTRYNQIRSLFDITFRGYDIQMLIAHDIAKICFYKKLPKLKSIYRFFMIHKHADLLKLLTVDAFIFSMPNEYRNDHAELVESVMDEIEGNKEIVKRPKGLRFTLNFKIIRESLHEVLDRKENLSLKEIIYYWGSLCYYKNLLLWLEKKTRFPIKTKAFIAFNGAFPPHNIWTVFFNKWDIPSYSLQHGLYVGYRYKVPMSIINYENLPSKKVLCWGKNTFNSLIKFGYKPERLIIAGNPKYKNTAVQKVKQSFKNGIVLLGRKIYDKGNEELLTILSEYQEQNQTKFYIKPHPSLSIQKYETLCKQLHLNWMNNHKLLSGLLSSGRFDFSISYNTTAYYESLVSGLPSFRFVLFENEDFLGLNDKFCTLSELEVKISNFKNLSENELQQNISELLFEIFNIGSINYKTIFK